MGNRQTTTEQSKVFLKGPQEFSDVQGKENQRLLLVRLGHEGSQTGLESTVSACAISLPSKECTPHVGSGSARQVHG